MAVYNAESRGDSALSRDEIQDTQRDNPLSNNKLNSLNRSPGNSPHSTRSHCRRHFFPPIDIAGEVSVASQRPQTKTRSINYTDVSSL